MTNLSPDELAGFAMRPTWVSLHAVKAHEDAMVKFLKEELPAGARFDVAGVNTALALAIEFHTIWPHYIPTIWELVLADRAGELDKKITELNDAFAKEG
jgi:hypothetical protein